MSAVLEQIQKLKIVPVIALDDAADAPALGEALVAGGLPVAEITFRTAAAAEAIRRLAADPRMLVGAGTVLKVDQAKAALDCGAKFLVAPGFNPKVAKFAAEQQVPFLPGVATPTEIEMALDAGLTILKFFPAEALGGVKMLKALSGPYGGVRFVPTGGIDAGNLLTYLRLPAVLACGGSWMVTRELINGKRFGEITRLTREAVALASGPA
jgi:2-dehydro-3-deoxyphosphogluconate aldolase / (4S)-4-hydroxy-2-oxoglutarate aldolase